MTEYLRPVERRVVAMRNEGMDVSEIADRLKRSVDHVRRMIALIDIPRSAAPTRQTPSPLARRVLAMRAAGETHEEIGAKFRRSARFIRQVEGMAHFRRGVELLS